MSSTSTTAQSGINNTYVQAYALSPVAQTTSTAGVAQTASDKSAFAWVAGWIVFITILAFISQTKSGHAVVYYTLVLLIILLLVTQYSRIATLLAPVGTEIPT